MVPISSIVLHLSHELSVCIAADDRLFPDMDDEDANERDRLVQALRSLADSVEGISTSDDPLLRGVRSLNRFYTGSRITLDNMFSWYFCLHQNVLNTCNYHSIKTYLLHIKYNIRKLGYFSVSFS